MISPFQLSTACALVLALTACDDKSTGGSAKPDGSAAPSDKADAPAKKDPDEGVIYAVSMAPVGSYKVGEAAKVEAVLEAKGGYKCNKEYPFKFKLTDPADGVTYENKVVKGIDRTDKRSVLSIPFTPTTAGEKEISGTFYFSVCNDDLCKIDKKKLSIKVDVGES